jgi:DNA-directed RNA polymerase subunit K/omega
MSDIEYEYDNEDYLDNEDNIISEKTQSKKDDDTLDNDDNVNDYLDDEIDENDEPDDNYEIEESDIEDEELDDNYNKNNFDYNELDKDDESKIQYIVNNSNRITSNILTIYEFTELIGIRATQISQGSPIFTDVTGLTDPMKMAKKEILDNKCPLSIKRYIGLDRYELWDPNIMVKPQI